MKEDNIKKEMKFLIIIVLYLLLAISFMGNFIKQGYTNPAILELFLLGGCILIFAFMTYKLPNKNFFYFSTYFFVFGFIVFFFYRFLTLLADILKIHPFYILEHYVKESIASGTFLVVFFLLAILFLIFGIQKKFNN